MAESRCGLEIPEGTRVGVGRELTNTASASESATAARVASRSAQVLRRTLEGLSYEEQMKAVDPTRPLFAPTNPANPLLPPPASAVQLSSDEDEPSLTEQLPYFEAFVRYLRLFAEGSAAGAASGEASSVQEAGESAARRLQELASEGFDIRAIDTLERVQEQVLLHLGYEAALVFQAEMNDHFAELGLTGADIREPQDRARARAVTGAVQGDTLAELDSRIDELAASFASGGSVEWLARELAALQAALGGHQWTSEMGGRAADGGIVGPALALELVVARARLRFPLPFVLVYEQQARSHLAAFEDPSSARIGDPRPPPLPLHWATWPLASMTMNAGHFVGGVVQGLESVGAAEAGQLGARLAVDGLLVAPLAPVIGAGALVGAGEALGEAAADPASRPCSVVHVVCAGRPVSSASGGLSEVEDDGVGKGVATSTPLGHPTRAMEAAVMNSPRPSPARNSAPTVNGTESQVGMSRLTVRLRNLRSGGASQAPMNARICFANSKRGGSVTAPRTSYESPDARMGPSSSWRLATSEPGSSTSSTLMARSSRPAGLQSINSPTLS
jgi:hypothetical protein